MKNPNSTGYTVSTVRNRKPSLEVGEDVIVWIKAFVSLSCRTFYNWNGKTASAGDVEHLKAKYEELERQVRQFLLRDFETENLRHENMRLHVEIKNLQSRNSSLEEQYEQLQDDYEKLKQSAQIGARSIQLKRPEKTGLYVLFFIENNFCII